MSQDEIFGSGILPFMKLLAEITDASLGIGEAEQLNEKYELCTECIQRLFL